MLPRSLPNVWIGTTVENQDAADERIPALRGCPAAVRFLSVEPLLEQVSLRLGLGGIDWVIVGCESGPRQRPCSVDWVRDVVRQCDAAGVPVFVKQLSLGGRACNDPECSLWPADLRRREWPRGVA